MLKLTDLSHSIFIIVRLQSVSSRYQNASWRAYDIARTMLDDTAYDILARYQQRVHVTQPDGTPAVLTTDRVQIILGEAIDAALGSAARYGAQLQFESKIQDYHFSDDTQINIACQDHVDIVAIFAGAHSCDIFPELHKEMNIISWPELTSKCLTWLSIKRSDKNEPYTSRGGEVGAEHWHFTIESSRDTVDDILRVRGHLLAAMEKSKGDHILSSKLESQLDHVDKVISYMRSNENNGARYDYIFTNAPGRWTYFILPVQVFTFCIYTPKSCSCFLFWMLLKKTITIEQNAIKPIKMELLFSMADTKWR